MRQPEDGWQRAGERGEESGVPLTGTERMTSTERMLPAGAGNWCGAAQTEPQAQSPIPGWLHWLESTATPSRGFSGRAGETASLSSPLPAQASALPTALAVLGALTHDARSMVTALGLYCDLLEEPGVLAHPYRHYARELRLVAAASHRLVEQLSAWRPESPERNGLPDHRQGWLPGLGQAIPEARQENRQEARYEARQERMPENIPGVIPFPRAFASPATAAWEQGVADEGMGRGSLSLPGREDSDLNHGSSPAAQDFSRPARSKRFAPGEPIASLADELMANRNLLGALAGPAVTVGLSLSGGYRPIAMAGDELTRVLVNLVKNASEAMPEGGHIQINLVEKPETLLVTVADTGCGFPATDLEAVFAPGYSTHIDLDAEEDRFLPQHRGLGLAIVRSLVTATGGRVWAANRPESLSDAEEEPSTGAMVWIEFPRIE